MDSEDYPSFNSKDEEIKYLRNVIGKLVKEKENIQKEFDDYAADSQQLEKEYEVTIDQHEKTIKDLKSSNIKAQNEIDNLRIKLEQGSRENTVLQSEINDLKNEKTQMSKYIRELEQKNDDLERAQRVITETLKAYESSFNNIIERNAILESEIDEKETLKEKMQRLADETRDLKQELQVREKERCPDNERLLNGHPITPLDNRLKVEHETQTTPLKRDPNLNSLEGSLSPSSKILAINIVGDLLRKVGLSRFVCNGCGRVKCTTCSFQSALEDVATSRVIGKIGTEIVILTEVLLLPFRVSLSDTVDVEGKKKAP